MKITGLLGALALSGFALVDAPAVLAPDSVAEAAVDPDVTGRATGRVVFDGEVPEAKSLSITEAQSKGCVEEGSSIDARDHSLIVGEDKGIANAVVTIAVEGRELVVPEEPVVLDQLRCRFDRHVVVVPVGAVVEYKNSDDVPHNVHTYSIKNKAFNRTLAGESSYSQKVEEAEAIRVKCDIHPWMSAWVFVADTNFVALTDVHGAFEIPGLPPGEYVARVWHEKLGKAEVPVVIGEAGESQPISVALEPKPARKRRRR